MLLYIKYWMRVCVCMHVQLGPTLCHPMDYSPPGSSVHGTFLARILEWVAISFSKILDDIFLTPGLNAT